MSKIAKLDVEPIRRNGVTNIIVDKLIGFVKSGQIQAGDRLPSERELSATFGVSRPTMREALKVLQALGVVEITHGGGVSVSALTASDLLQPLTFFLTLKDIKVEKLYEARSLIEGEIAALAARKATQEDIQALNELVELQSNSTAHPEQYRHQDTAFHERLGRMADNPFLARAAQSLNVLGLEFRRIASETPQVLVGSIRDHKKIVAAITAGKPEEARISMRKHMEFVLKTTFSMNDLGDA